MKQIIESLKQINTKLLERVERRRNILLSRSVSWRTSVKGEIYREVLMELELAQMSVKESINYLESVIDMEEI